MERQKVRKSCGILAASLFTLLFLAGCGFGGGTTGAAAAGSFADCQVVIEDGEGFQAVQPVQTVQRGADLNFLLQLEDGYAFRAADYPDYETERTADGQVKLTLHQVRYSTVVSVRTEADGGLILYDANGGTRLDGKDSSERVERRTSGAHAGWNTAVGTDLFERTGFTLTGWNTRADGSGTRTGLGSRTAAEGDEQSPKVLYAQWSRWNPASDFTYRAAGAQAVITGYTGSSRDVTIPAEIDGKTVIEVGEGAFAGKEIDTVIFPKTLLTIASGAFDHSTVRTICLTDSLQSVNDYAFSDCEKLQTLFLNAAEAPVYSGTYFDTFQDKYDRLRQLKDKKKIVLFSGSSARFGYDSEAIDAAFPEYEVVNMGVFAYTNAVPQLMLILGCMKPGDILIDSPEFDAAKRQFCTNQDLDEAFYRMMESDYDVIAGLDLGAYDKVFSALSAYLKNRRGMTPKSYALSAADFDEDGRPSETKTYNIYGDYIVKRANAGTDAPIYGLKVDYTCAAFPKKEYLDPLNAMYRRFQDAGVAVYFIYAPRNRLALSGESTEAARAELDAYLRKNLAVPVLSGIEDSLLPGRYFYGTDNHLSTEGVQMRTEALIRELKAQQGGGG